MAASIELTASQGDVKRIAAKDVLEDQRADALWYSPGATIVQNKPETLSNVDRDWLVWRTGEWLEITISADPNDPDGQGVSEMILPGFDVSVEAVAGTAYRVAAKHITRADSKQEIFLNSNRQVAEVGDTILNGDAIVAACDAEFKLRLNQTREAYGNGFIAVGVVDIVNMY